MAPEGEPCVTDITKVAEGYCGRRDRSNNRKALPNVTIESELILLSHY